MASRSLFDEGLLCYSAGAYRAALVFSYLGLLRSVAHKLMTATKPLDFPQSLWDEIQAKVRDDVTWEAITYDSLIRRSPVSLFLLDDDLRNQIEYWRGRRNDAAHARMNEIGDVHVESLWLFARSNLRKLIVAGGRAGLFERFRRHFAPSFTPPGADFSHLVREIPLSVRRQNLQDFLRDLLQLTGDLETEEYPADEFPNLTSRGVLLVRHINDLGDEWLIQALMEVLRSDQRLLIGAILSVRSNYTAFHAARSGWILCAQTMARPIAV